MTTERILKNFVLILTIGLPLMWVSVGHTENDSSDMAFIAGGWFEMGSGDIQDEWPQHRVFVDDFSMDRYEVTNAKSSTKTNGGAYLWVDPETQWVQVSGADWRHPRGPGTSIDGVMDHPVINVSYNDALAFCRWADKRLPTEAEWEKAARGTDGRKFPWGDESPNSGNRANFADKNPKVQLKMDWAVEEADDGHLYTAPVGSYPQGTSPYGLLDMAGNAWEWCSDWYGETYYPTAPEQNPPGPDSGEERVLRGGGFFAFEPAIRCSVRFTEKPGTAYASGGFRCARSVAARAP